jgi:HEPN domain-containing protein
VFASMSDERLIANQLRLASIDLQDAQTLIGSRNAVYHAEQCAEHIVLALAQAEAIHFDRSYHHQLDRMVERLPNENLFKQALKAVTWLEAYATTYRYPTPSGRINEPPRPDKLNNVLGLLGKLLREVSEYFEVDLAKEDSPAAHAKPPRKST